MNARQMSTWREIVQQCKSRAFNSINVASERHSDAILAVDVLVELVTPELAQLLEKLASYWYQPREYERAEALAARIRAALEETE